MRLFLLFHGRFPSEKAASLFAAKSAEAFATAGLDVTLVVPRREGISREDPFGFYGVRKAFKVEYVPTIDLFGVPGVKLLAFWASFLAYSLSVRRYLKAQSAPEDIVYSNETLPLYFASKIRPNAFYEMHDFPESKLWLFGRILSRAKWILAHNSWKAKRTKELYPDIPDSKILIEPNAVEIEKFDQAISKEYARAKLGLPLDRKIAVYTGHLYPWKGVDTLAEAAKLLSPRFLAVIVGGTEADIARMRERYGKEPNIVIAGYKPHKEMPLWQKAGDILVLPNTAKEKISAFYTSPMKLFEYMASKRPIVASDIPSIREIVGDKEAVLVSADDKAALARAMGDLLNDSKRGEALAMKAFEKAALHTWDKRAQRILVFIEKQR